MHMRTKKWARPELEACPFFINSIKGPDSEPGMLKGTWRNRFADPEKPLHLEMGCGKAVSTAKMIADNPEVNFVAADLSADVLGVARRNITPRPAGRTRGTYRSCWPISASWIRSSGRRTGRSGSTFTSAIPGRSTCGMRNAA